MKITLILFSLTSFLFAGCHSSSESNQGQPQKHTSTSASQIKFEEFPIAENKLEALQNKDLNIAHQTVSFKVAKQVQKSFKGIYRIFSNITIQKSISAPIISKTLNVSVTENKGNCRYERFFNQDFKTYLGKIDYYKVYYQTGNFIEARGIPEEQRDLQHDCIAYGNLVYVDQRTNIASVLHVYYNYNDEEGAHYRFFTISNLSQINIYEFDDLESGINPRGFHRLIYQRNDNNIFKMLN